MIVIVKRLALEHPAAVLAKENVVRRDRLLVQRGGDHDDLEGGARLVHVRDRPVLARQIVRLAREIRIEVRQVGQRQDFSRSRTHHDAANALGVELLHRFRELFLDDVLDEHVNRKRHVQPRTSLHVLLAKHDDLALTAIRLRHAPATGAPELRIQPVLDAIDAVHLHGGDARRAVGQHALRFLHIAEHVRGKASAGIDALEIILRVDAFATQVAEEHPLLLAQQCLIQIERDARNCLSDLRPLVVRHLALQIDKLVRINDARFVRP